MTREAALSIFEGLGVATVPLAPRSKRPLRSGWQRAGGDPWRGAPLDANVGVLGGAASGGLVVLDFDDHEILREVFGMSPASIAAHTVVVRTARGFHVYARCAEPVTRVPREGFSVLGEGSLAVAPPSVHPSGVLYSFVGEPQRIAKLSEFGVEEKFDEAELADERDPPTRGSEMNHGGLAISLSEAEAIVRAQNEKVIAAWRLLTTPAPADRVFEGSGTDPWSRADFLVALCLIQHGLEPARVARLLMGLEGSKAAVRGAHYAIRTCERAAETARTGRLPARRTSKPS